MKIKSVDIEGMHNVQSKHYEFDNATYIYGPNGSGKSTILEAILWGLLGHIPGTPKKSSSLFMHANSNKMQVAITLQDSENQITVIRTLEKIGTKINESLAVTPSSTDISEIIGNLELPILNFSDFLSLTANKQKDLMMSILPSSETAVDTKEFLKSLPSYCPEIDSRLEEIINDYTTLKSIDDVKAYNTYLKELQSSYNGEEKRITATAQSLIFYDDYEGEADVETLKSQIDAKLKLRDTALQHEAQLAHLEQQKVQLAEYDQLADSFDVDTDVKQWESECQTALKAAEERSNELKECQQEIIDVKAEIANCSRIISSHGICPFIEDNCERIESEINKLEKSKDTCEEKLKTLETRAQILDTAIKSATHIQHEVNAKISNRKVEYEKRDALRKMLSEVPELDSSCSSSILSSELQQLNDDLVKAAANEKYQELTDVVNKQKLTLMPAIAFIKEAVKQTGENGLQSDIMEKPFSELAKALLDIQKQLKLELLGTPKLVVEAKANSFDFGFERDSFVPFNLLSSGEKCIFTLMLMLAILRISDTQVQFIMIDDLLDHLDDKRFKTVIDNIQHFSTDTQVIFAGVKPIQSTSVTLIELGSSND